MMIISLKTNIDRVIALALLATVCSCSAGPVESEYLAAGSRDGAGSLRFMVFGILAPGDSIQKVMVENSRNNTNEFYGIADFMLEQKKMSVAGELSDNSEIHQLNPAMTRVNDPFEMPYGRGAYEEMDRRIAKAIADEYYDLAKYYMVTKAGFQAGMTRWINWLFTDKMVVRSNDVYRLNVKLADSTYPDIEVVLEDSTLVPGDFDIIYPSNDLMIKSSPSLAISWSESKDAAGYRLSATTPHSEAKVFEVLLKGNSIEIPTFFEEKGLYQLQVWALDQHYFQFLSQRLDSQRVDRTHFFDYGEMNLSALVVFGSRVMRSVEFTVE
jgi:hypothetical protein